MRLKDIGEFGFIRRIAPMGEIRSEGVIKGIGDDCAVVDVGGPDYLLVTTDLMVERVHFMRDWASPETVGAKAVAINLSDIAACGGQPRDAFVSIAIPQDVELDWLDGLYRGMTECSRDYGVNVLGGDTTGSKTDMVINIALTGTVPRDQVLLRHTASPGDVVLLTGPTGESGAGCEILLSGSDLPSEVSAPLIRSHVAPRPHIKEGRLLAESRACTAAIDVSDGISSDLGHLCEDSGIGAVIYEEKLPMNPFLVRAAEALGKDPLDWILHGGEDYVLLAAIRADRLGSLIAKAQSMGCTLYPIGEFVANPGMILRIRDGRDVKLASGGWNHFV